MCVWDLLKTFCVATGPSINFRQPSVRPKDNLLTICASVRTFVNFANFLCARRNFRKLSVHPCDLPSLFPTSAGSSINVCRLFVYLRDHPSTFCASAAPFVKFPCISMTFIKLSAHLRDLPSTSVNILCIHGTFCQLSVHPWAISSTFRASAEISSTSINFRALAGPSVNIPYGSGIFHPLLSTFCASVGHSVKFLCIRGTFHQLSVLQRDLPSISINFPFVRGTFHQLCVCLWDLPSTSVNILSVRGTFRKHFMQALDLPSTSVNFLQPLEIHSTFLASVGPSINFHQLTCMQGSIC